ADQLDRARARGGQVLVPVQEQGQLRALEPQGGAQRCGQVRADEVAPEQGRVDLLVSVRGIGGGVAGSFAGTVAVPALGGGTLGGGEVDRAADPLRQRHDPRGDLGEALRVRGGQRDHAAVVEQQRGATLGGGRRDLVGLRRRVA